MQSTNYTYELILFKDHDRKKTLRSATRALLGSEEVIRPAKRARRCATIDDRAVLMRGHRNAQQTAAPHTSVARSVASNDDVNKDGALANSESIGRGTDATQADNIQHQHAQGPETESKAWLQLVSTNASLTNEVISLKNKLVDSYKNNVDLSQKFADSCHEIKVISKQLIEKEKEVEGLKTKLKELSDSRFSQDLIDFDNSNGENVSVVSQIEGVNSSNLYEEFDPLNPRKQSPKGKPKKVETLKMLCCAALKK